MGTSKPQHTTTPKTTHSQVSGLFFLSTSHKSISCIRQMTIAFPASDRCPSYFRTLLHQMTIIVQSQKFSHFRILFHPNIHIFPCYLHFYYFTGICNKWKISKSSKKQYISYLLKNHCFSHFFTFLQFYQDHPISQKPKNTIFHYFPCGGGNAIFLIFTQ